MTKDQKKSKSEQVYQQLKEMIVSHELAQGAPLSERNISHLFEASRTPVREALKRLSTEHFVEMTPEYGALVSKITYETILEVYETREVLEGLAAKLCAENLQQSEKLDLERISAEFLLSLKEGRFSDSIPIDMQFHSFLITHSRNSMLSSMINMLFDHSRRITRLIEYTDEWSATVQRQHSDIAKFILEGNGELAEAAMREHIASSRERHLLQIRR